MAIMVSCPSCTKQLRVPDDLRGKSVRCPSCQTVFTAEGPGAVPPPPPNGAPQVALQQEAPAPPPRERDDDREHDYPTFRAFQGQPHRGTLVMALGIIGLAIAVVGMCPYLMLGEFVAFGLGLSAWLLGRRDLAAIGQGEMDPTGKDSTQVGWICGLIAACLSVVILLLWCAVVIVIAIAAATAPSHP